MLMAFSWGDPMFRRGDKVVCIDDTPIRRDHPFALFLNVLKKGDTYIVRECYVAPKGHIGVRLKGTVLPKWPNGEEAGFYAKRFALATAVHTDISIFQRICDDVNRRQTVGAD
jgi:hypothetical protein